MTNPSTKDKPKHPGGRPPKITESEVAKLREAFLMGCTDIEACLYAGINKATLYRYQEKNPEFCDQKQAWKENPTFIARRTVYGNLEESPDMAFKYLERKRRDEFGPKSGLEVSGPGGSPIPIANMPPKFNSIDEWEKWMKEQEAG